MEQQFLQTLQQRPMLADGAMGTLLYARGIPYEQCFDALNLSQPDLIGGVHRDHPYNVRRQRQQAGRARRRGVRRGKSNSRERWSRRRPVRPASGVGGMDRIKALTQLPSALILSVPPTPPARSARRDRRTVRLNWIRPLRPIHWYLKPPFCKMD